MPRLKEVHPRDVTNPYAQHIYKVKFGDREFIDKAPGTDSGAPGNWETVMAQVPDALELVVRGFGFWQSPDRELDAVYRELAMMRVGWYCGCQFVFSQHCKIGRIYGVTEDKIAAVPSWQVADCFTPVERAVLAYADCLAGQHGRTPDGVFDTLKANLSEVAIVELTYIATMYIQFATITRALQVEFDERPEPVVEVPAPEGYKARMPVLGVRDSGAAE